MSGNILTHKAPIRFDGFSSTSEEDAVMEEEQQWRETTSKRKIAIKRKQRAITTTTFSSRQKKKQKQAKGLRLDHSNAAAARLPVPRPNTPVTNPVSNHFPTMVQTNRSSKVGLQVLQQQQQQQYFPTPWGMSAVDSSFARQPQHHHNHHESATRSSTSTRQMDNTNTTITGTTEIHLKRRAVTSRTHSIIYDGDGYPGGASTSNLPHGTSPELQGSSSASTNNSCQQFVVDANAPFLALLEGVQASSSSTTMDDYIANVIQEQRHSQLRHSQHHYPPRTARMMELPCEAKLGNWLAELVPPPKEEQASQVSPAAAAAAAASTANAKNATKNANASHSAISLQGYRMSFRHHSSLSLGPLRGKEDGDSATLDADSAAHSALTVSLIHPNLNRFSSVQCQGIVANLDQFPQSFIGSLSIVGFDGFTCSSDMNSRAGEVSASILKRVESSYNQTAPDQNIGSAGGSSSSSSSQIYHPSLMGIAGQNAQHSIGTSILCGLSLDTDYQVWIGQDQGTCGPNNNPIVALDIVFPNMTSLDNITSSTSKNSLLQDVSEEQEDNNPFFEHQQLTEQRLRMHTYSVGRGRPYDPCQRLWGGSGGGNQNQHTFTTHHLMDQPDKPKKKAPHRTKRNLEVPPVIETKHDEPAVPDTNDRPKKKLQTDHSNHHHGGNSKTETAATPIPDSTSTTNKRNNCTSNDGLHVSRLAMKHVRAENNAHLSKTRTAKVAVLVQQLSKQQEPSTPPMTHKSAKMQTKPPVGPRAERTTPITKKSVRVRKPSVQTAKLELTNQILNASEGMLVGNNSKASSKAVVSQNAGPKEPTLVSNQAKTVQPKLCSPIGDANILMVDWTSAKSDGRLKPESAIPIQTESIEAPKEMECHSVPVVTPYTHKTMGPPPKELFAMDSIVRVDDEALEPFDSSASPVFDDLKEEEAQITPFSPASVFTNDTWHTAASFVVVWPATRRKKRNSCLVRRPRFPRGMVFATVALALLSWTHTNTSTIPGSSEMPQILGKSSPQMHGSFFPPVLLATEQATMLEDSTTISTKSSCWWWCRSS